MGRLYYYIEEIPINHKITQTNARLFSYFSDIAEMGNLSIIAIVKGNRTNRTKKKGEITCITIIAAKKKTPNITRGNIST